MSKSNKEFFAALALMEQEKGISAEYLAEKIENAIVTAVKKEYGGREIVFCDIDMEKQKMKVYVRKEVVEEVEDSYSQLTLEQARIHRKNAVVGGHIDIVLDTKNFGRIMAQTCKHVIRQGIKEAEKGQTLADFLIIFNVRIDDQGSIIRQKRRKTTERLANIVQILKEIQMVRFDI